MKIIIAIFFFIFISNNNDYNTLSLIKEGNAFYINNNFTDAELKYRNALEIEYKIEAIYNLGDALYRQNKFEEAADKFYLTVSRTNNPQLKYKALYNLGNSQFKSKDYRNSINSYISALKINPDDDDVRYNLELARKLLSKEQQQNQIVIQQPKLQPNNNQLPMQNIKNNDSEPKQLNMSNSPNNEMSNKIDNSIQNKMPNNRNNMQYNQNEGHKISIEDAERLLNALTQNEKEIQMKIKKEKIDRKKFEKNW